MTAVQTAQSIILEVIKMKTDNNPTFEEILQKLEEASNNLKKDNITLNNALKNYEEGIAYYKKCSEILNQAKQKIETYSK